MAAGIILTLKCLFLFLGINWTFVNFGAIKYGHSVTWQNFALQSVGITGFIFLQWII
jgi:hypothetical protein